MKASDSGSSLSTRATCICSNNSLSSRGSGASNVLLELKACPEPKPLPEAMSPLSELQVTVGAAPAGLKTTSSAVPSAPFEFVNESVNRSSSCWRASATAWPAASNAAAR
eukprot:scaffold12631_cov82-Isochrysis_galbana.AAC.2